MAIGETKQKTPRYYTIAVLFLGLVFVLTVLILAYSMAVGSSNKKSAEKLENLNKSITALSNDPDIQAYQLYEQNKRQIDNMAYFSDIPLFYEEITDISREFAIKLSEFSYTDKKISVAASALNNPASDAYEKYENLISSYRKSDENIEDIEQGEEGEESQDKMFDLEFVRSFQGENRIVTNLDFTILEPKPEKVETEENTQTGDEETSTGELIESE